jgi:L,D-peptidoglycan transpeptidase YkuD (ErfK/YbiS/YcfS/YnhG family)
LMGPPSRLMAGQRGVLHLARENFGPTAGCVSMTKQAMRQLLWSLGRKNENRDRVRGHHA